MNKSGNFGDDDWVIAGQSEKIAELEWEVERLCVTNKAICEAAMKDQTRAEAAEERADCWTPEDLDEMLGLHRRAEAAEALLEDCRAGYRTALATTEAAEAINKEMAAMLERFRSPKMNDWPSQIDIYDLLARIEEE